MSILQRARPELLEYTAYESARAQAGRKAVLLNANEAPWSVVGRDEIHRYPDPQPAELVKAMASYYGVAPEQVLVTRGSDEAIDLLVRAFCREGQDQVIHCPPTFGMYACAAAIQGAGVIDVELQAAQDYQLQPELVLAGVTANTKIVFLTSPNNPTGNLQPREAMQALAGALSRHALVVVDEAYIEFTDAESMASLLEEHANLVVLRTLSKAFGLAGARCGAALAGSDIIQLLRSIMPPYPLPTPTSSMALEALSEEGLESMRLQARRLMENKRILQLILDKRKWLHEIRVGDANFVLAKVEDPSSLTRYLGDEGVLIRDFSNHPLLRGCLRISVGSEAELRALAVALDAYDRSHP